MFPAPSSSSFRGCWKGGGVEGEVVEVEGVGVWALLFDSIGSRAEHTSP